MADRIKNYEINYNILSNAGQAAEGFASLLGYVEKLSGALRVSLSDEEIDRLTEEARKTGVRQQGSWEPQ